MKFKAEHVFACSNIIGEAPLWVPEEETLYWTDTESSMIWSLRETGSRMIIRNWKVSLPVTAVLKRAQEGFLLVTKQGLAIWDSITNTCELVANPLAGQSDLSFNDGAVDRSGRVITGTMNHVNHVFEDGCIYQLACDLTLRCMDRGLSVANGIGISLDGNRVYVSEQFKGRILMYEYNSDTAELSEKRVFAHVPEEEGLPDGIIVDAQGYVWNAHWGGSRITRYDPGGKRTLQIEMPVPIVACMAFGGKDLTDLYVTTGSYNMSEAEKKVHPGAGDLFRIATDIQGLVESRFSG